MSLQAEAQILVVDPSVNLPMANNSLELTPLEVSDAPFSIDHADMSEPLEVEIVVDELPGAPPGTPDPEPLEVSEKNTEEDSKDKDKNNDNDTDVKSNKWDWSSKGPTGFVAWIKERLDNCPKHSGYDSAGLQRASAYLEKLDSEISKAMRLDLDGELDANKVEAVRAQIDEGLSRLHDRLEKVNKHSKSRRKKKADVNSELVKEAQKIMGVQGIIITVPLLISRIARVCINGMVSAGHDIEHTYREQVKKYKLNDREQAETIQLLFDMGYPMKIDRGYQSDEEIDPTSSDNFDWSASYQS